MSPVADPSPLAVPPRKIQVSIRLDADVVTYFKRLGPRYQTRINQVLRQFVDAHPRRTSRR